MCVQVCNDDEIDARVEKEGIRRGIFEAVENALLCVCVKSVMGV